MSDLTLHIAAVTNTGMVREHNEDCVAFGSFIQSQSMESAVKVSIPLDGPVLCLVADGMGGHAKGEVASQFAAVRLQEEMRTLAPEESAIKDCLCRINRELFIEMEKETTREGMGTTVAGIAFWPATAFVFNVGDSRVYRQQDDFLAQVTTDDVSGPQVYGDDSDVKRTHTLTQALGGAPSFMEILPHVTLQRLEAGHLFIICSDGLTDMVGIDKMEATITEEPDIVVGSLF